MSNNAEPMEVDAAPSVSAPFFSGKDYGPIDVPAAPDRVATYAADGPRLIITHIVNENFKSYAGRQTLGPFHKSFTSIVGPNGSGKSNVIDSMLFVFGYRASKIRSKKISVLIHNSENHRNVDSCFVGVHFQRIIDTEDGDKDFTVVENSQFVVSRTAFKDNSSFYSINGKRSTYKEVALLLRASGIDLDHNRFLILQGEVEQIAMMKPKAQSEHDEGMLEFLEDIVGSSRFKDPIDLLTGRVEQLNEFRGEKLNRVKAVEKEKDELEGAKNEALDFLTSENNIINLKHQLYHKYIHECTEVEEKATIEFNKVKQDMNKLIDEFSEITDAKKEKSKQHRSLYKQYEALVKQCEDTKEKFSDYEQQDVKCREDLKHSKARSKQLEKTMEDEKKKIDQLSLVPEESQKAIDTMQKKLEKLEEDKNGEEEKLKVVMDSLKTETQGMQADKDVKEQDLIQLQKAFNESKSQLDVIQSERELYLSNHRNAVDKLEDSKRKLDTAQTNLKQKSSDLKELEKNVPSSEKSLQCAKNELTNVIDTEKKSSEELSDLRVKVEEAKSSLQAAKSQGKVIGALLEQKRLGNLPGIYGRLGDLGTIDMKYDVAISTACGALDNIVCDSIDTAQNCVEFLKTHNVGFATFIGLDKMNRWKEHIKNKIQTPQNVPRLFDLVTVKDGKMLPAFYFALRDTLVADNLDQATSIAYGKTRYRVVTLQGQLIDQSGTMSGGGTSVCKGRMGSSFISDVDPKQLNSMENKLQKLSQDVQQCRTKRERLEDQVRDMERSLTHSKHTVTKYSMEVKALHEQEASLKTLIVEQEKAVKAAAPDEKYLKELEGKISKMKKEFDRASTAASAVESEVKRLHQQIMDIGGTKMQAVQSRMDAISSHIDQVTGQITKANVGVKTAKRNLKKAEDKVKSVEDDINETKQQTTELEGQLKQLEIDATDVLQKYQEAENEMKASETALEQVRQEVAELEEKETLFQKENIEVKHELERAEGIMKANQSKLRHWKKEVGALHLHDIIGEQVAPLPTLTPEDLAEVNKENVQYEITIQEEKLTQMKPNMAAINEYRRKEDLYLKRVAELDEITQARNQQRKYLEELRQQRLSEFMAGFSVITNKLKEMYQMITLGGDAELELVDSLDPFSEGIVFSVRPPKKSWKNISNLSGGEKTLSSLALVFALHHYKPTPLYVMDEIDAALDFKNVSIVANYIKERTKNAQFIIISLRNNMFELADRLVGIYKTDNCTKSVTINPEKISIPLREQNV